jgi:short-subunit dehydrogenase involved in D-alanine esterification of teichoic acids
MFRTDLLKSKRILITGGGTGLGKGMAHRFLELGATVYICGRREEVLKPQPNSARTAAFTPSPATSATSMPSKK